MTALARLDDERRELLSRTICNGATRDEMELFFSICERTGLDPFARQIYAVKRWDGRAKREVMQTQVSIDGFRLVAQRSGEYAGQTAVHFCGEDGRWTDVWLSNDLPAAARVGVYRKGFVEAVTAVALFREYAQRNKEGHLTSMWSKMPTVMIAKCAEALALRKAFPAELSGLYTAEEMAQQDNPPAAPAPVAAPALPAPEAQETAQDAPAAAEAPKPVRKRKAAPDATAAAETAKADNYPDEYEGKFIVTRVVRRANRPFAIGVNGEHGNAWVSTTVAEYADLAEANIGEEITLEVARIGTALSVMRVIGPVKPIAVDPADVPF